MNKLVVLAVAVTVLLSLSATHAQGERPPIPVDCGNGSLEREECDDGNNDDGDGCSAYCECETYSYVTRRNDGTWEVYPVGFSPLDAQCDAVNIQTVIDSRSKPDELGLAISLNGRYDFGDDGPDTPRRQLIIWGPDVTLSGPATIEGGGGWYRAAIEVLGTGAVVEQITLDQPSWIGIHLIGVSGATIRNNVVVGKPGVDAFTETVFAVLGSSIQGESGFPNVIESNTLGTPEAPVARGVMLGESFDVIVEDNSIYSHWLGITVRSSQNTEAKFNHITGCNCLYDLQNELDIGLAVYGESCGNEFLLNTIEGVGHGIYVNGHFDDPGLECDAELDQNVFARNTVHQVNGATGINLAGIYGPVQAFAFIENTTTGDVDVAQVYVPPNATGNEFIGNDFGSVDASALAGLVILGDQNTFTGNTLGVVPRSIPGVLIDAVGNTFVDNDYTGTDMKGFLVSADNIVRYGVMLLTENAFDNDIDETLFPSAPQPTSVCNQVADLTLSAVEPVVSDNPIWGYDTCEGPDLHVLNMLLQMSEHHEMLDCLYDGADWDNQTNTCSFPEQPADGFPDW